MSSEAKDISARDQESYALMYRCKMRLESEVQKFLGDETKNLLIDWVEYNLAEHSTLFSVNPNMVHGKTVEDVIGVLSNCPSVTVKQFEHPWITIVVTDIPTHSPSQSGWLQQSFS